MTPVLTSAVSFEVEPETFCCDCDRVNILSEDDERERATPEKFTTPKQKKDATCKATYGTHRRKQTKSESLSLRMFN
jgi:hypothetical protein